MATANSQPSQYSVRQMTLDDILGVIELQVRAFPGLPPWRLDQLERHLEVRTGMEACRGPDGPRQDQLSFGAERDHLGPDHKNLPSPW